MSTYLAKQVFFTNNNNNNKPDFWLIFSALFKSFIDQFSLLKFATVNQHDVGGWNRAPYQLTSTC